MRRCDAHPVKPDKVNEHFRCDQQPVRLVPISFPSGLCIVVWLCTQHREELDETIGHDNVYDDSEPCTD